MLIIFGWGLRTTHVFGAVFPLLCPNCHNERFWILTRVRAWFTFFFVPIFPYESSHRLTCPVCGVGREVSGAELKRARLFAETNAAFAAGHLRDEEYGQRLEAIAAASDRQLSKGVKLAVAPTIAPVAPPVEPTSSTPWAAQPDGGMCPLPTPPAPPSPKPEKTRRPTEDCPGCGTPFESPDDLFCPRCGARRPLAPAAI
jgi:hypothetical protein